MSKLENGLLDGVSFIRSFINTCIDLIFFPVRLLRSMETGYNSSIQYIHPAIFLGISTFLSFILKVDSHSNIFNVPSILNLTKTVPAFVHNASFIDILFYISPIIVGSYASLILLSNILWIPKGYRRMFRSYGFYSFGLVQLFYFCVLLIQYFIDRFKPVRVNDPHLFGSYEVFEIALYFMAIIIAICLPIGCICVVFYKNKRMWLGLRFLILPFLIPFFYSYTDKINDVIVSNREEIYHNDKIKYSFPSAFPDQNYVPIRFKKHNDSVSMNLSIMFNNPTNKVFFLPECFSFSYKHKESSDFLKSLRFSCRETNDTNWENNLTELVIKPSEVVQKRYTAAASMKEFNQLLECKKENAYHNAHMSMSYYNFEGNSMDAESDWRVGFSEELSADSTRKLIMLFLSTLKMDTITNKNSK